MNDDAFYLPAGAGAALVLGVALIPLREDVAASNLAFAFVALTIAIAEMGGRVAAMATALCSALSLNFFLTKPYLRLTIHDRQDVIAFVGLAAVGLIAAAFGSRRERGEAALGEARRHLELLAATAGWLSAPGPAEGGLERVLEAGRRAASLHAIVVRDVRGYVAAASAGAYGSDVPARVIDEDLVDVSIPAEGVRMRLLAAGRAVGWLDLWGGERGSGAEARRTLVTLARLLALRLAVDARAS